MPTALAPPTTSSVSPACSFARLCTARYPVWNGSMNAAASMSSSSAGASNTPLTPASAKSATPPNDWFVLATTRLPIHSSAPSPAASTTPHTSMPMRERHLAHHAGDGAAAPGDVTEVERCRRHLDQHLAGARLRAPGCPGARAPPVGAACCTTRTARICGSPSTLRRGRSVLITHAYVKPPMPGAHDNVTGSSSKGARMSPDSPSPDTIVLIHGFWVTPRSWEDWMAHFETQGLPRPHSRRTPASRSRSRRSTPTRPRSSSSACPRSSSTSRSSSASSTRRRS